MGLARTTKIRRCSSTTLPNSYVYDAQFRVAVSNGWCGGNHTIGWTIRPMPISGLGSMVSLVRQLVAGDAITRGERRCNTAAPAHPIRSDPIRSDPIRSAERWCRAARICHQETILTQPDVNSTETRQKKKGKGRESHKPANSHDDHDIIEQLVSSKYKWHRALADMDGHCINLPSTHPSFIQPPPADFQCSTR